MLDQKYRVRVSRDPMLAGERQQARSKKLLTYGLIGGGIAVVVLVGLVILGTRRTSAPPSATSTELKLVVERGDVQVQTPDAEDFVDATDGQALAAGSTVRTEGGAIASLELSAGSVVRINENSRLEVSSFGSDRYDVRLVGGEAWSTTVTGVGAPPVALSTLEVVVRSSGTSFNATHGNDQSTVSAVDGTVTVAAAEVGSPADEGTEAGTDAAPAASVELDEGSQTTVTAKNRPESEDDFDVVDIKDETLDSFWFRFNQEKDAEFAARIKGESDTDEPTLKVTTPKDGAETSNETIEVAGTTDVSATVEVNGKPVDNELGKFSTTVTLKEGDNEIVVTATDAAGNEAELTITVTRTKGKPAAVTLEVASEEAGKVTLSWSESDADNFASYKVKRDGSAIETITEQGTTSFTDTGLKEQTEYSYVVCVVDDEDQESCSSEQSITPKTSPNKPPTVSITSPTNGGSVTGGQPVSFSATGTDPESAQLTYTWDFGDGVSTTGATASHAYAVVSSPQSYTIKITVSDPSGASAEASITITVNP